jgi:type II secretory pathway component GspD/PulD (secretin)
MKWNCYETAMRLRCTGVLAGMLLTAMLVAPMAGAQTQSSEQKAVEVKTAQQKAIEYEQIPQIYQIFHLVNATRVMDLNDIQTNLRNMLTRAKIYGVASQNAISIRGTAEDLALSQKIITELDRPRKVYRLTYTITDMDGGKRVGAQHFAMVVSAGGLTNLKQGNRVPIVTGSHDNGAGKQNTEVQYQDVGLNIDASLDGESLHSKVVQTSLTEERSGVGLQDPIVRQTVLDATTNLTPGKAVVLGSLDIPGSTRHEEIEVAMELVP